MPLVHITKRMSATRPALVNHFSPLMTHSSPSRVAYVLKRLGSEPPCGSVIEYADHSSWLSIGSSQRFFCSSVPYAASISMLPVSGAADAEHLRRRRVPAEDLVEETELELPVAGAAELLVEEDRKEALVLDLVLEVLDQTPDLRVLRAHRVREDQVERLDLLAAELVDPIELLLELGLSREIPRHRLTPSSKCRRASLPPRRDEDAGPGRVEGWPTVNRPFRLPVPAVAAVLSVVAALALGACGSSSKSDSTTSTTTSNKALTVDTPDGQASLALNGALPPGWPTDFPVPDGSTPKGSGSLANDTHNFMVGVYTSSQSPRDAFDFYNSGSSVTPTSHSSVGVGSAFVGQVSLGGKYAGSSVVVTPGGDGSYIVVLLKPAANSGTTTSGPATSTSAST